MKKSLIIGLCAVLSATGLTSCLDTESGRFAESGKEMTSQDSAYRLLSVLNGMKTLGDRIVLLGELRGDLMQTTEYADKDIRQINEWTLNENLSNKYLSKREYYTVINECNYIIKYGSALPKEQAVATTIRAWAYLQLALNYGEAEYYEEPILTEGQSEVSYPKYDLIGLTSLLIPQVEAVRGRLLPYYGTLGGVNLKTQYIDATFLLGDLYLWRGQGDDYLKAATLYANLIQDKDNNYAAVRFAAMPLQPGFEDNGSITYSGPFNRGVYYSSTFDEWTIISSPSDGDGNIRTNTTSASVLYDNTPFGGYGSEAISDIRYMSGLTAVPSRLDSLSGIESSKSGLSIQEAKEKIAITASPVYSSLASTTKYTFLENEHIYVTNPLLAWIDATALQGNMMQIDGDLRINTKFSKDPNMTSGSRTMSRNSSYRDSVIATYLFQSSNIYKRKTVSIYRAGLLYLRYAEAVNRAGMPSLAMITLKYGLNPGNVLLYMASNERPTTDAYGTLTVNRTTNTQINTSDLAGLPILNEAGAQIGVMSDATTIHLDKDFLENYITSSNASSYPLPVVFNYDVAPSQKVLSITVMDDPQAGTNFMMYVLNTQTLPCYDLTSWLKPNVGLHWRGAGCAAADPTYCVIPEGSLADKQAYMDAVICDEYALETAFEGGRFYDLMRFSKHQNNPDFLADRVAKKYVGSESAMKSKILAGRRTWDAAAWYLPTYDEDAVSGN